jgi:hypothetical protein
MNAPIYLDYNATTPVDPRVADAIEPYLRQHYGNPSSSHIYGRRAHEAVEQARNRVAELISSKPAEIVFTGCAIVGYEKVPLNFGAIIHLIRETAEGCEMRSRFWLGKLKVKGLPAKGILNKIAASKFAADHAIPDTLARDMFVHCATEINHLASFLPEPYSDYH